jgi:CheY-like chemotaxis protein
METNRKEEPSKILFADDEALFRKVVGEMLILAGYEVVMAEDGPSALQKLSAEKPDLVISDVLMPGLNGLFLCKVAKILYPDMKVILLTAIATEPVYETRAKTEYRADALLRKPIRIADLIDCIEGLLSEPCQTFDSPAPRSFT